MKVRLCEGLTSRSRNAGKSWTQRRRKQRTASCEVGWLVGDEPLVQPRLRGEGVLLLTHRDPDAVVQGPFQLHQLVPPDLQLLPVVLL